MGCTPPGNHSNSSKKMKQQVCSVLISCLLASTFFHGLQASSLAAHKFGGGLRAKRSSQPTLDLTLSVLDDTLIVKNTTSSRAILIDTKQDVILLLDGCLRSGVVISQRRNEATLIPDGLWDVDKQTLTEFLRSIGNDISSLLHRPSCTDFSIPRVHVSILKEIATIVEDLVVSLDPELEQRPELALELVLSVATGIEDLLKGSIKGILTLVGDEQIQLSIDISGVQNLLQGIDNLNSYLKETALGAIKKSNNLELSLLLGARDGLVGLSEFLRVLGEIDDLSPLNSLLGDPETFAEVVAQFGGNSNVGINGVFRVVSEILAYAKGSTSLERVISILIQVVAESSEVVRDDLNSQLKNSLSNLLEILKINRSTESLKGLVTIVEDLLKKQLIVDGVNISDIISTILSGIVQPKEKLLNVIVTVLKSLSPIVDPSQSIPELLLVIIVQLDSASGIRNLISLGIDLGRSGCACSLLQVALESVERLADELSEDLYDGCSKLPIVRNIIVALEVVLKIENLNLRQLLSIEFIQVRILAVIQLVSEVDLGIKRPQIEQAGEILRSCNGLSTLVAIDVTVSVIVVS